MSQRENLLITLYAYATARGSALSDLQHARVDFHAAQNAYDKANEDYQRVVYNLLTLNE